MKVINKKFLLFTILIVIILSFSLTAQTYKIVDTGQEIYYDASNEISTPAEGQAFYGQDAQIEGYQPSYINNGDGTVTDNVTELMWFQSPDLDEDGDIDYADKLSFHEAEAWADTCTFAGYDDWRVPTIKEQYSLIMFYGVDPSGYNGTTDGLIPFIDTNYFAFGYGDEAAGERIIDAQFVTSTLYEGLTMMGDSTMFGVNFADGRIKGYPIGPMPGQTEDKQFYVLLVRGNSNYGINNFTDNNDGTVTDNATGLMWQQNDSQSGLNWEESLAWVQQKNIENYLGYNDWRLPNVKELQCIVDYTRSIQATNSPAIDPLFSCTLISDEGDGDNYPFYWSSTTHANMMNGGAGAYVCFGEALGFMEMPPESGNYNLLDVHGAGAQRSDPKSGNPNDYPYGHGPQGDVIRIYNYVRLVRDDASVGVNDESDPNKVCEFVLKQNYPNPFNPETTISFSLEKDSIVRLEIFNVLGESVDVLVDMELAGGEYLYQWNSTNLPGGIYFYALIADHIAETRKMVLLK